MTYLVLTVAVLALVGVVCLPTLRRLAVAPLLWTGLVLVALTAVFDSAIVGFGLTVYDPTTILGVYVGAAPIEDFGYTIAAVMIMPTLWTVLGRRRGVVRGGRSRQGVDVARDERAPRDEAAVPDQGGAREGGAAREDGAARGEGAPRDEGAARDATSADGSPR